MSPFAERYAEVIADDGIYQEGHAAGVGRRDPRADRAYWKGHAHGGFVAAIETCGKILAEYFPPETGTDDELPNHLIVLDAELT